jgi:ribonucleoside-diphosphate reductase alpha chain
MTHENIAYTVGVGFFHDDSPAEIFINAAKSGSHAETAARDGAVLCSIALQFGAPLPVLRHAMTRNAIGEASGPLGKALDIIADGAE